MYDILFNSKMSRFSRLLTSRVKELNSLEAASPLLKKNRSVLDKSRSVIDCCLDVTKMFTDNMQNAISEYQIALEGSKKDIQNESLFIKCGTLEKKVQDHEDLLIRYSSVAERILVCKDIDFIKVSVASKQAIENFYSYIKERNEDPFNEDKFPEFDEHLGMLNNGVTSVMEQYQNYSFLKKLPAVLYSFKAGHRKFYADSIKHLIANSKWYKENPEYFDYIDVIGVFEKGYGKAPFAPSALGNLEVAIFMDYFDTKNEAGLRPQNERLEGTGIAFCYLLIREIRMQRLMLASKKNNRLLGEYELKSAAQDMSYVSTLIYSEGGNGWIKEMDADLRAAKYVLSLDDNDITEGMLLYLSNKAEKMLDENKISDVRGPLKDFTKQIVDRLLEEWRAVYFACSEKLGR